jgi:hypothetical protein
MARPGAKELIRSAEHALSTERLRAYALPEDDLPEQRLARYYWNVALSEALLPALCQTEVVLRNAMDRALQAHVSQDHPGTPWFDVPNILQGGSIRRVQQAKQKIRSRGKPTTHGRIVAELTLGFWTALLNKRYDAVVAWPKLVRAVVPHAPNRFKNRARLQTHVEPIRKLRNRVAHHEPIWRYEESRRKKLTDIHRDAVALIGWMSPSSREALVQMDRFEMVYRSGLAEAEALVQALLK